MIFDERFLYHHPYFLMELRRFGFKKNDPNKKNNVVGTNDP